MESFSLVRAAAGDETEALKPPPAGKGLSGGEVSGLSARLRVLLHRSLWRTYVLGTLVAFALNVGNEGSHSTRTLHALVALFSL
jgi:hypothetical protein